MTTFQVFFRVDANEEIGTGHLARCRLLARELREKGVFSVFLTSMTPNSVLQALEADGFALQTLAPQDPANSDAVLSVASQFGDNTTLLIVDSDMPDLYKVDFQHRIRSAGMRLMMITFRHDCHFVADIVHNQNLLALQQDYSVELYTRLLLGPRYATLADGFTRLAKVRQGVPRCVKTLLISFGGSDRTNQVRKAIMALTAMKNPPQRIIVVVGLLYAYIDDLKALITRWPNLNLELHINTSEMPTLMAQSDLAITSCGSTVWELACVGVPNVIISTSERERQTGILLGQKGHCCYLGHRDQVSQNQISGAVETLIDDEERRQAMALCSMQLVDGRGIQRVVEQLLQI